MKVRLTTDPDERICLESPFDRPFVDGLKQAIDYGGRAWDAQRKRWLVSALYAADLLAYLQRVGVEVQDDRAQAGAMVPLPPMPEELRTAFDGLFLAYTAPLCVAEASFKALAKYWHPDKGGSPDDFNRVNTAIQVIRSYLDPKEEAYDDPIPF